MSETVGKYRFVSADRAFFIVKDGDCVEVVENTHNDAESAYVFTGTEEEALRELACLRRDFSFQHAHPNVEKRYEESFDDIPDEELKKLVYDEEKDMMDFMNTFFIEKI